MYSFQTQRMAQFHREELQRAAAVWRVNDSTNAHPPEKQSSNHMRRVIRRVCLLAFSLGVIAGGMLTTHFGLLPSILLGSFMMLVISPLILIQLATALKVHLYTFQYSRTAHWWGNSRWSR